MRRQPERERERGGGWRRSDDQYKTSEALWIVIEFDINKTTDAHWQALGAALQQMLPQLHAFGIICADNLYQLDDVLRDLVNTAITALRLQHLQLLVSLSDLAILNAVRLCQNTIVTLDLMENVSDVRHLPVTLQTPLLQRLSFEIDVDMATVTNSTLLNITTGNALQTVCVVLRSSSTLGVPLEALVVLLRQYFPRVLLAANRLRRATLVLRGTQPYVLERAPWEEMKGVVRDDASSAYRLVIDARAGMVAGVNRFPAEFWMSTLDTIAERMSGGRARPEVWYTDPAAGTEYRLEHGRQPVALKSSDRLECRFGS